MRQPISRRDFLKRTAEVAAAAGLSGCSILLKGCSSRKEYDIVIKDGNIIDGLGGGAARADVGISGNLIKKIGRIPAYKGKSIIEAKNLTVCPGFIDAHDHTDIELLVNPKAESSIRQGITTLISGNCGSTPFPIAEEIYDEMRQNLTELYGVALDWMDIKGFFSRLEERGMALNYASLVGQGTIRGAAMGFNDRPPKQEEMERMKLLVADNIKNGALGISTGLEYTPGSFASAEEVTELCEVAAELNAVYATHMRSEGDFLIESLDESIDVARKTGISLQISHFKVAYPRNWDKIDDALSRIEKAKKEGIHVFCDRYPYIAGSTGLSYYFPLWARQGTTEEFLERLKDSTLESKLRDHLAKQEEKLGSWDKVVISSVVTDGNKRCEGKSILEASKEAGKEPFTFIRDLLIEEKNRVGMVTFMMSEENLKKILAHPLVGVGTDGSAVSPYGILGRGKPHPRLYGTFPRVLGKYVREEKVVPLREMIRKITSVPAQKFQLEKRGIIWPDYYADLVVFDEDIVIDRATWRDPHLYPDGIYTVIVNGQVVIDKGEHTDSLPGWILRKKV